LRRVTQYSLNRCRHDRAKIFSDRFEMLAPVIEFDNLIIRLVKCRKITKGSQFELHRPLTLTGLSVSSESGFVLPLEGRCLLAHLFPPLLLSSLPCHSLIHFSCQRKGDLKLFLVQAHIERGLHRASLMETDKVCRAKYNLVWHKIAIQSIDLLIRF